MNLEMNRLSSQATEIFISVNPNAGSRSTMPAAEELASRLTARGYSVQISSDIGEIARRSRAAQASGHLRAVVAAGGDGTVGLVANNTAADAPIAVLPLGTENLLSKYLRLQPDPESVCNVISDGYTTSLDMGRVNGEQPKLFLLMFSCGFDADVVKRLHDERQGHIHHLSYAKPILDSIRNYQYPEIRIQCGSNEQITARWGFVFNLPCYALGLQIAPQADGTDGLLDVCTFKEGSLWNGLLYLGGVVMGQHESWTDCCTHRAQTLRIESDQEVPYSVDGDPGGYLPVDIEVIPAGLRLLVPQAWAADHDQLTKSQTA